MLTKEQILHIAKLARIKLTQTEIKKFQTQLSLILEYIEQLNEVDTSKIESITQVTNQENVTREDKVVKKQELSHQQVLSNAPREKDGYFKVKAVL